ncbi:MAG: hypothetical protein R2911_43500 [Caldilineaceae bacterium]
MSTNSAYVAYIPLDRRTAMAQGVMLPDRTHGAALFADISGFTQLTETLAARFGARRGADELARRLNMVYTVLIAEVHRFGGSVIGFSGDAIMCWFDGKAVEEGRGRGEREQGSKGRRSRGRRGGECGGGGGGVTGGHAAICGLGDCGGRDGYVDHQDGGGDRIRTPPSGGRSQYSSD